MKPNTLLLAVAAVIAFPAVATSSASAQALDLSGLPDGAFTSQVQVGNYYLTPRNMGSSAPIVTTINGVKVITQTTAAKAMICF